MLLFVVWIPVCCTGIARIRNWMRTHWTELRMVNGEWYVSPHCYSGLSIWRQRCHAQCSLLTHTHTEHRDETRKCECVCEIFNGLTMALAAVHEIVHAETPELNWCRQNSSEQHGLSLSRSVSLSFSTIYIHPSAITMLSRVFVCGYVCSPYANWLDLFFRFHAAKRCKIYLSFCRNTRCWMSACRVCISFCICVFRIVSHR